MKWLLTVMVSALSVFSADAIAQAPEMRETIKEKVTETVPVTTTTIAEPDWLAEFIGVRIPSFRYMRDVAQCETGVDPAHVGNTQEGHTYRGAFGFYTQEGGRGGTWDQWGGWEFARYANEATYRQQVIIYLRVHVTGFYDYRPDKQKWWEPAGLSVNNCSRYAGEVGWFVYRGANDSSP